jgi:hypothetical protein
MSLKRRRLHNDGREERLKRAKEIVEAEILEMKHEAASIIAAARIGQLARRNLRTNLPESEPVPDDDNDWQIEDDALAALELPVPTPVPPVPLLTAHAPYVFDRDAARIKALGRKHAEALAAVEEQAGYIEEMPSFENYELAKYLRSKRLTYDSRFVVLTFLTMNRVPPILVVELFLAAGMLSDQSAFDHVLSMLKKMRAGSFDKYRAYCMETRLWENVQPPRERRGSWLLESSDWPEALAKMRSCLQAFYGVRS